ncbi:MAG: hypothetical protein IJ068_01750 [Bacilli bacterium]|nr:hypothetical protein [Bacilli bacterium]
MDNKKELLMLLGLLGVFSEDSYINYPVSFDMDVNDCLINMYFYMLSSDEKYYQEFHEKYNKLNDEQREFVKNDYINIINAQREFEKVKRKGEKKYE